MSLDADKIAAAVAALQAARPPGEAIAALSENLAPADESEAWAIHQAAVAALGPVVGWKVGAPSPEAEIGVGELAAATVFRSPATIPAATLRLWAVEAEIAVTFGQDLAEGAPFAADDVVAAVDRWHAAIEVLDTAFSDWHAAPPLSRLADRMSHGALILGNGAAGPPPGPLDQAPVKMLIDGEPAFDHRGGNTGGDPLRMLVALANRLAATDRPIRAGDVVTSGSTTPFRQVSAGQRVRVEFEGLDPVELVVAG